MIQIVPAILATTEEAYKANIEKLWESNFFDRAYVQIDLMDGEFVKGKSIGPEVVKKYPSSFKFEVHLMVNEPLWWAEQLKDFKIVRYIVPIELPKQIIDDFISFVRAYTDCEIGFSINPETEVKDIGEYLSVAEAVVVMAVPPGKQGQEFIPEVLEKVKELSSLRQHFGYGFTIGVDGGVSSKNAKLVVDVGADYLVVGSHLVKGNIDENLEKFWEVLG